MIPPLGTRELCVDPEVGEHRVWDLAWEPPVWGRTWPWGSPKLWEEATTSFLPSRRSGIWSCSCGAFSSHPTIQRRSQDPRGRGISGSPDVEERKSRRDMELRVGSVDGAPRIPRKPPPGENGSRDRFRAPAVVALTEATVSGLGYRSFP